MNKKLLEGLIDLNTIPENRKVFTQQLINQPQLIKEVIQIAGDEKNEIAGNTVFLHALSIPRGLEFIRFFYDFFPTIFRFCRERKNAPPN